MSTRRRPRTQPVQPRSAPPKQTAPRVRSIGSRKRFGVKTIVISAIAVVAALGIGLLLWNRSSTSAASTTFAVGSVDGCRKLPRFTGSLGFGSSVSVSTSEPNRTGLVLIGAKGGYQAPTWDDAGTLGPFAIDRDGNIYTAPAPHVSYTDVVSGSERTIYRVDTLTGVMAAFMIVSPAAASDATNRFGILGLTYDCDTHSLYATTVAGSTRQNEVGQIVRIDLTEQKVIPQVVGVDALGIGVVNSAAGKRLYFGSARQSDVYVVDLDDQGNTSDAPRLAFSFGAHDLFGNARVRRFSFAGAESIHITTIPFVFNLRAGSNRLLQTMQFQHDAATDSWSFEAPQPQATP